MNGPTILILGVLLIVAVILTVVAVIFADRPEGRHASDGYDSGWGQRPPEIATEPQYHSAPPWAPAAAPTALPRPAPPPVIHHDEFRPQQRWHEPVARHHLPPSPALAALAAVTAGLRAHLAARDAAFQAEAMAVFPPSEPFASWLSPDTIARGELTTGALAEYEKTLAAKDGA